MNVDLPSKSTSSPVSNAVSNTVSSLTSNVTSKLVSNDQCSTEKSVIGSMMSPVWCKGPDKLVQLLAYDEFYLSVGVMELDTQLALNL